MKCAQKDYYQVHGGKMYAFVAIANGVMSIPNFIFFRPAIPRLLDAYWRMSYVDRGSRLG